MCVAPALRCISDNVYVCMQRYVVMLASPWHCSKAVDAEMVLDALGLKVLLPVGLTGANLPPPPADASQSVHGSKPSSVPQASRGMLYGGMFVASLRTCAMHVVRDKASSAETLSEQM